MSKSAFKNTNADKLRAALDQATANQLDWHRANAKNVSEDQLELYEVGYRQGWLAAVGAAQLHKLFKE